MTRSLRIARPAIAYTVTSVAGLYTMLVAALASLIDGEGECA